MGWEGRDGNLGFWGQPVAALILALGLRFWAEPMVLMVVPWLPLVESWVLMASAVLTIEGTAELCLGHLLRLFMLWWGQQVSVRGGMWLWVVGKNLLRIIGPLLVVMPAWTLPQENR